MKLLLQPPVTSSLFGPNILLSALFSNTLSLCSSLNVRDQVSHCGLINHKNIKLGSAVAVSVRWMIMDWISEVRF
jgi:hypothetical protein